MAFIGLGIPDSLFGAAWPAIYPDLGLPVSVASLYSILSSLATIVSSLCSDRLLRRFGTARVAAFSTALTAAGLLALSFSGQLWLLCLCALPLGLGAGAVDTVLNNYVALHYSPRQMSFLHCFYGVGVAASPYLLSLVLGSANDWRGGYRLMFAIQLAIALVMILTVPLWKRVEQKRTSPAAGPRAVSRRGLLKNRSVQLTLGVFFGSCMLESLCLGWAATWLVGSRGLTAAEGAACVTLYYVGMTLGRFVSGLIAARFTPRQILLMGQSLTLVSVALLFVPVPAVSVAGLFGIGLGNGPVFPNMTTLTPQNFGAEQSQRVIGLQMAFSYLAFMITPALFSVLAGFLGVGIFAPACTLAMVLTIVTTWLLLKRTAGREETLDQRPL